MTRFRKLNGVFAAGVLVAMSWMAAARGGEIDFREDFALAQDRAEALKQLIPGTEDFYYFHALYYLHTEQFPKVQELLTPWVQRHGETQRVWEIRTRYNLLTYPAKPQETLTFLKNRLGLNYPHARELLNAEPNFPVTLDPALVSREAFQKRALAPTPNDLNGVEDAALESLVATELNPNQRRNLLSRLSRPDVAGLVKAIVEDLNHQNSGGFGSHGIHRQLLLAQLEELLKAKPELLNHHIFVNTYLVRLQPGADENWQHDTTILAGYLTRLKAFVDRLQPVHNSLKAHVIYHQLLLDRKLGKWNKELFLEYLKLPRPMNYISKALAESEAMRQFRIDPNSNFEGGTLLAPIGNDEPLVRSYLAHFLVEAADTKEFEPFINDIYLKHLFAEVKILNGLGSAEQWAALLPPAQFQALKERVDIEFDFKNPTEFSADEKVVLELHTKNVSTLMVKVFEINTKNFYRNELREIDTDINLDGLVANIEETNGYAEPPLRRVTRKFEFPQLTRPGIYVIDFIGNGRSSRALIRKGSLRKLVQTDSAGHTFVVLNGQNEVQKKASVWMQGHEYESDENGQIAVPFSTNPGRQPIVLTAKTPAGEFSSLDHFQHQGEDYQLQAGFYVDREALLTRKTATLLIRSGLTVSGTPISVKLLEQVKLVVTSTDLDGISSSQEINDVRLFEDRETTHDFQVPQRLASIHFALSAKIPIITKGGEKTDVSAAASFSLNGIDKTDKIEDLHLLQADGIWVLELRGKTGESRPSRPISLQVKHRDFRPVFNVTLKTDPAGRIVLGKLAEITTLTASGPEGTSHTWELPDDKHTFPSAMHGLENSTLTIPYLPRRASQAVSAANGEPLARSEVSLLGLNGEAFVADFFDNVRLEDGLLHLEKLPAGDYSLLLKSVPQQIRIRIAAGKQIDGFAVSQVRQLQTKPLAPVQVASVKLLPGKAAVAKVAGDDDAQADPKKEGDAKEGADAKSPADPKKPIDPKAPAADAKPEKLVIELANWNQFARVHIFATRYVPEYDVFGRLDVAREPEPFFARPGHAESVYLTGRNIGDEYRYIIDRRYAPKFPGNMLDRPSLLLNPWAVRETETGVQVAEGGDVFGAFGGARQSQSGGGLGGAGAASEEQPGFANLDFLSFASAVLVNLEPSKEGVLEIDRAALGDHQHLHIVVVDPTNVTYRSYSLVEPKMLFVDLRLKKGLDPQGHFTQQKQITILPAGQKFTLADITTSKFEAYDSLSRVYGLYATLNSDPKVAEFAFILQWPTLKDEEKREKYSKYACHELSFFLYKKDPAFFEAVIKPYLQNKKDKTFVDDFLLGENLQSYLSPWRYDQLNTTEKILLTRRIADERQYTSRRITELYQLLPPNVDEFLRLFDTAVQRSALDVGDPLGLSLALESKLSESLDFLQMDAEVAATNGARFAAPAAPPRPAMESPKSAAASAPAESEMLRKNVSEKKRELQESAKEQVARDGKADRGAALKDAAAMDGRARLERADESDKFFRESGENRRQAVRQLYRKLDKTWEWAENNYYHITIDQQGPQLVPVSGFWKDFAQHDPATPFYSKNLAEAHRNFPEIMFAMALLDLPFESPKHETKFEDVSMTLTAGGPLVVFHEEIRPSAAPEAGAKVLVSENIYRQNDRHRIVNGETVDKFISEEFLVHVVYGCQVVVTNPTSTRQKLNLLVQIPQGSLPVLGSQTTRTVHVTLEPYHTQTLDYYFYFPAPGKFGHFPVHVARGETLIAAAEPLTLNVVDKPTKIDTESWEHISQHGTNEQVLEFLDKQNVASINLDRIAWRMKDAKMFTAVIAKLSQMHAYNHTLWSYSLMHDVPSAAREFLQHADKIVNDCGGRLTSPLLVIDPVLRRQYEHLEYKPLVNARAHSLGKRRQIVNDRYFWQYHRFLTELCYEPKLGSEEWLAVTYYLLLQDRVEESLASFARIDAKEIQSPLQYEYCQAYLSLFREDLAQARAIALKHANHPVDRWQKTFAAITAQIDEAEGKGTTTIDRENREQRQAELAATEPNFDFVVEAKKIRLDFQNLPTVRVNFYEMDVELLFSRNPFVQQFQGQFNSIKANHSVEVPLPKDQRTIEIPLPELLLGKNVIVEVVGAGQTRTQAYYAHTLAVQTIENYGQIKVTHQTTGKPVSKAYVKVYARLADGQVKFFKDGYTDIRGRFDYSSLNTNDLDSAQQFSILILSDEFGATVREASPPKR